MNAQKNEDFDWKAVPVYRKSPETARENNELEAYRKSNVANQLCAKSIENAISANWNGFTLKDGCVQPVMEEFGTERVMFVLANTLQFYDQDSRFSRENRAWAQMVQPEDEKKEIPEDRRAAWVVQSHSVKIDVFTKETRKAIEEEAIRETPVYREPYQYAMDNNETKPYWDSHSHNISCRDAIDQSIADHYDGFILHAGGPEDILKKFGKDRTYFVLANTIQLLQGDGRISRKNVVWADGIPIPHGTNADDSLRRDFLLRTHPGLLNLFVSDAREAVAKSVKNYIRGHKEKQGQQPSILEKLDNPASHVPMQEHPSKKKEQVI